MTVKSIKPETVPFKYRILWKGTQNRKLSLTLIIDYIMIDMSMRKYTDISVTVPLNEGEDGP